MSGGLMHLYTGEGKGKTTAALGLALRAAGCGLRVAVVQFLKGRDTGELHALALLPHVTVLRLDKDYGFFFAADDETKNSITERHNDLLAEAKKLADEGLCDLLVLDEICAAYQNNAVDRTLADMLVLHKPQVLELVLTGRNAPAHWADAADYVTEMILRKHPYTQGIAARKGIEF